MDALKEIFKEMVSKDFEHHVNIRKESADEVLEKVNFLREKYHHMRPRIRNILVDLDGTATMDYCSVGILYDLHGERRSANREERNTTIMGIAKIRNGRVERLDEVFDTTVMKLEDKELTCVIS